MRWEDHPQLGKPSMEERQFTNVERFARRMPPGYPFGIIGEKVIPHCIHYKKRLHKKIEGTTANYHFMKCTDCGMMDIMLINKQTGEWMNRHPLSRDPKDIRETIINFYEAKQ